MGEFLSWFLQQGIVRVLSVPIVIVLLVWLLWVWATPPPWQDDESAGANAS
jgi:hypothetical protein